jgi:squalene-hopene/tetraprenyl-beta-curcumene cyclase
MQSKIDVAIHKGIAYLKDDVTEDGAWIPLWFGNQSTTLQENPTYGTAQVILSLLEQKLRCQPGVDALLKKGCAWLRANQNLDGGWGGARGLPSTIEETALALGVLSSLGHEEAVRRGVQWLIRHTKEAGDFRAAPIGLYFASLWYDEKLYPIIFTVSALRRILESVEGKREKPSYDTVENGNPEEMHLHSTPPFPLEG